jgi:hypothetical protein
MLSRADIGIQLHALSEIIVGFGFSNRSIGVWVGW